MVAYAGTDDWPDVWTDIFQGARGGGTDYEHAISDAADHGLKVGIIQANNGKSIKRNLR